MAIAIGSQVILAQVESPTPTGVVEGVGTGGAGTWDVIFADKTNLQNADTAALLEIVPAPPIPTDPQPGDTLAASPLDPEGETLYVFQFAAVIGIIRVYVCDKLPPGSASLPWALAAGLATVRGHLG